MAAEPAKAEEAMAGEESKALTSGDQVPEVKIAGAEVKMVEEFKGLTKEELMKYATDPFWVRLRWVLFILFWVVWVAMLVASVVIIVYAPKCPSPDPKEWWQKGPVYKVDIAKFKDSDNDGKGDLKGLISELDYLVDTGINTIYLPAFFKGTGWQGVEYGVSDYRDIDPALGSMADWADLINNLDQRNIKVIIDFIPGYSSEHHQWFELSSANTEPKYKDYYIWSANAGEDASRWELQSTRSEYFYKTASGLPELNLNNRKVVEEVKSVMEFWMAQGVDGFNLVDYAALYGVEEAAGDKRRELVKELRRLLDEDENEDKILMTLTDLPLAELGPLYGDQVAANHVGALFHLAGGSSLVAAVGELDAASLDQFVGQLTSSLPVNAWTVLAVSSEDSRIAETEPDMLDAASMLSIILPATPLVNFGEELGLRSGDMNWEMKANQTKAASEGRLTHYGVYSGLTALRHQETILFGRLEARAVAGCLVVSRVKKGNPGYILVINTSTEQQEIDLSTLENVPENIRILTSSISGLEFSLPDPEQTKTFPSGAVPVGPRQAKMFTFVPQF